MKKTFTFEYDEERSDTLSYQVSLEEDEMLDSSVESGVPFVYLNRSAMVTLAKILIKMATGSYRDGFHVHLHKDFNSDAPESVVLLLSSKESKEDPA
jgi:hypothetical protein